MLLKEETKGRPRRVLRLRVHRTDSGRHNRAKVRIGIAQENYVTSTLERTGNGGPETSKDISTMTTVRGMSDNHRAINARRTNLHNKKAGVSAGDYKMTRHELQLAK